MDMAADPASSVEAFRKALRITDRDRLKRNGFHLRQAIAPEQDRGFAAIKICCLHEAMGSDQSIYSVIIDAVRPPGQTLDDEEGIRLVAFLLDEQLMKPFPGLLYKVCRLGWVRCATMLVDRGMYKPLAWTGFSGDSEPQETTLLQTLIQVVNPSDVDLCLITGKFNALDPIRVRDVIKSIRAKLVCDSVLAGIGSPLENGTSALRAPKR